MPLNHNKPVAAYEQFNRGFVFPIVGSKVSPLI